MGVILFIVLLPVILIGGCLVAIIYYSIMGHHEENNVLKSEKDAIINSIRNSRDDAVRSENITRYNNKLGSPITYSLKYDRMDQDSLARVDWLQRTFRGTMRTVAKKLKAMNDELKSYSVAGTVYEVSFRFREIKIAPKSSAATKTFSMSEDVRKVFDIIDNKEFWNALLLHKGFSYADNIAINLRSIVTSEMADAGMRFTFKKPLTKGSVIFPARENYNTSIVEFLEGTAKQRDY